MKRFFLFLFSALCMAVNASGQTDQAGFLQRIESGAAGRDHYSIRFSETRKPAAKDQAAKQLEGQLEYRNDGFLSMVYTNGDQFLLEGDNITFVQDGKTVRFDTSKNLMMGNLKQALLLSFQGRLQELADGQNADLQAVQEKGFYVASLTARKKAPRGYRFIRIRYSQDGAIQEMQMEEFSGASTHYTIKK